MHDHNHDPRWDRNWRRMEAMARRGFRKFSHNINSEWGGFGGNFRIGRMLASGDLRLVALYLIEQQPRHGYDLIKAVEERSNGFYSPSPGIVYPALTFLEEAGYVTSAAEGNKKLYTITDEGRAHLADNREAIESTLDFLGKAGARMEEWRARMASPDFPFTPEQAENLRNMGREFKAGWPFGGPEHEHGPHPERPGPTHHAYHPDHDMPADVDAARKALKRAVKAAAQHGPAEAARIIDILNRATAEIRGGFREDVTETEMD